MKAKPRRRSKPTKARAHPPLAPVVRADWFPPRDVPERMDRAVRSHRKAEKALAAHPVLGCLVPLFSGLYAGFWDFAIDDAIGKSWAAEGKRMMRDKGRTLVLLRRHGMSPQAYLDTLSPIQQTLAELRTPGRSSKAPFHDVIAACCLLAFIERGTDNARWPEELRRFLELPELGYHLPHDRMRDIANDVIGKVAKGKVLDTYPTTAAVYREMNRHYPWVKYGGRVKRASVRNASFPT